MDQSTITACTDTCGKPIDSVYFTEQTFDGMTVRGIVVLGSSKALIFDTLVFPDKIVELRPLWSDRELIVVYSHADWDHIWGTCGLPQVEIIAHEECAKRFADASDVEKTLSEYREKFHRELASIKIVPPQRTFQSDMTLDLGGISVELHHCPGHTKDSIFAIIPERAVLLGADCIETPLPLLNEDSKNLTRWISVLQNLEADTRIATCIPSHGKIGGKEILSNNIAYLESLLGANPIHLLDLDAFYEAGHRENLDKTRAFRNE